MEDDWYVQTWYQQWSTKSPYLDRVGRIVGGLTPAKCRQSLVGSRQHAVYECQSLFSQLHVSLQHTRSDGRIGGRILLCVTYLCRRCLGYELRDREVVIHFPRGQVIFFCSQRAHCGSGAHPAFIGCGVLFLRGSSGQGVNLNAHICVVPWFLCGSSPSHMPSWFCTGTVCLLHIHSMVPVMMSRINVRDLLAVTYRIVY